MTTRWWEWESEEDRQERDREKLEADLEPTGRFGRFLSTLGGGFKRAGEEIGERLIGPRERRLGAYLRHPPPPQQVAADIGKRVAGGLAEGAQTMVSGQKALQGLGIDISGAPRPLREIADVAVAPITAATAGIGGGLAAALRGGPRLVRPLAGLAEPVMAGCFGRRLAGEIGLGTGALL